MGANGLMPIILHSVEYGYLGAHGHVAVRTMHWADKVVASHDSSSLKKVVDSLNNSIDIY